MRFCGLGIVAEEVKSADAASVVESGEVRCVGVDFEMHVTLFLLVEDIGMSGGIVEKLCYRFYCFIGSLHLFEGDGAEGDTHSAVDGAGIIEEFSDDVLDFGDDCFVERG